MRLAILTLKTDAGKLTIRVDDQMTALRVVPVLSTGRTEKTFRDAILGGKPTLAFDPQRFIEVASAHAVASRTANYKTANETLGEILDELADLLGLSNSTMTQD